MKSFGRYVYRLNGEVMDIQESWTRQATDSGLLVESRRVAPGVDIRVRSRVLNALVQRSEIEWRAPDLEAPVVSASYELVAGALQVQREQGGDVLGWEIPAAGQSLLLSPLMRIYAGDLIAALLQRGGESEVMVPYIANPDEIDRLLQPVISRRSAALIAEEDLNIGGTVLPARCCEYLGDQYAPGTRFWLGEDNTLLRYCWLQEGNREWDVRIAFD